MSASAAAGRATGLRTVRAAAVGEGRVAAEEKTCSVTAAASSDTWPETASGLKTPATTVAEEGTSPETARSRRRSANSCATTAARLVTWHVTVTTPTSRSAIPAAALDTSRSAARRSSATDSSDPRNHHGNGKTKSSASICLQSSRNMTILMSEAGGTGLLLHSDWMTQL